jgi:UDP-N-acetylmuramate dehydrogenase
MNFSTDSQHIVTLATDVHAALERIDDLNVRRSVTLAPYTRFQIGGPAELFAETASISSFVSAIRVCHQKNFPLCTLGDGSNVIVSDMGFRGLVLRFTACEIRVKGFCITADAGARLEAAVTTSVNNGLQGLETLARIPGSVGAAIFGNAGAYGSSISETITSVKIFDGTDTHQLSNQDCDFVYRGSTFKQNKGWIIFQAELQLRAGNRETLSSRAAEITAIRDEKFPPTMLCAGSIFKNLYLEDLPDQIAASVPGHAVRKGKVSSAHFLEKVGAKGMCRGNIQIADYHANLIYNRGGGKAQDLRNLISDLKKLVKDRFGIEMEEEVQYIGDF